MSDIVERLRQGAGHIPSDIVEAETAMEEAADEIARLRAETAIWSHRACKVKDQLREAAAFLDGLASRIEGHWLYLHDAASCREMARNLRGET